jgi:hypothetical protein
MLQPHPFFPPQKKEISKRAINPLKYNLIKLQITIHESQYGNTGLKVGFQFWWPAGHQLQKSGAQAQILVAKVKKIGSQR